MPEWLLALFARYGYAVVFSGGEPTAQGALQSAVSEVREMGFRVGLLIRDPGVIFF